MIRTTLFSFVFLLFSSLSLAVELKDLGEMPEFQGIQQWFNGPPLSRESLKGKVVLVDFWTYTCINCIRTLPYLKDWHQKYKDKGFVIVGLHSPEFEFEKDPGNVKKAIAKFQIPYPVALDNQMATWNAFKNQYWPAHYFIDAKGRIRHTHFGEGEYEKLEEVIRTLLAEAAPPKKEKSRKPETSPTTQPTGTPAADLSQIKSPETYLGYIRRERLVTSGRPIELNEWNYEGDWRVEGHRMVLKTAPGKIRFRFHATKVNLVIHPGALPASALVRLDGQPVSPEKSGKDIKSGKLDIFEPRLFELINLGPKGEEHIVEVEFLHEGVEIYAFTFG